MILLRSINRVTLIVLDCFLAICAMAGGVGLIGGWNAPSVELLKGSPFQDYAIPGLALLALAGGSALLAAILLLRKSALASPFATFSGIVIMFFEFVEVLIIGSPPGPALALQIFFFGLGALIALVAIETTLMEVLAVSKSARR